MSFLVPDVVSQDLLLIRDIIGVPEPAPQKPPVKFEDNIDSSDSENPSEDEIEADLVKVEEEDAKPLKTSLPSDSTSESDSDSDSDSSDSGDERNAPSKLVEADIVVPDIEEVGADEVLEKVGEVMSIIDKIVIVKGAPSEVAYRTSAKALDSDTLLVFEDRKVLGYIYETFGPTLQPLYQVKFSALYPIDPDKVQLSRPVFHVPQRSNFVFVDQIKKFKGSDASNVHDEEPADDELEFSDDEAEAMYKSSSKRKRESRANSVASSRQSTPSPAQMRDQDLAFLERNPYDDHSPYDDDFGSGSSRPAPMPYDDPYSDEYNNGTTSNIEPVPPPSTPRRRANSVYNDLEGVVGRGRGRGRGRGTGHERGEGRGRGRGRVERGRGGRGRGNNERGPRRSEDGWPATMARGSVEPYDHPRSLSPTSMAIARATGQFADGSDFTGQSHSAPNTPTTPWAFDPSHQFNFAYPNAYQSPFVQPHINPRFASAFGMNFDFQQPQQYHDQAYHQPPPSGNSNWTDEWTVHGGYNPNNGQ
ncbi:Gar1/Naf1 RNA binding region-domain-containing protein [Mycena sp. CBHHK59/15]|nr:Gar1/Naf1 RNA binding region-domain-containing protein [Mycena sp. CBHHK59/15]